MARGYPDYANPVYSLATRNIDFGLLATALIGKPTLDGRGRLLFWETWAEGSGSWLSKHDGDGEDGVVTILYPEINPVCMYLNIGTLVGGGNSGFDKNGYIGIASRMGLEVSFTRNAQPMRLTISLYWDSGAGLLYGSFRFDNQTGVCSIYSGGGWVNVLTSNVPKSSGLYISEKLAVDFSEETYIRLMVGEEQVDLESYPLASSASSNLGNWTISVLGEPLANLASVLNIGHVFLTADEP